MNPSENTPTLPAIGIDFGGTTVKFGVVSGCEVIDTAPAIATDDYSEPSSLIDAIMTNEPKGVHFSYQRYVVNQIRKRFGFQGTPIRVRYRGKKNRK